MPAELPKIGAVRTGGRTAEGSDVSPRPAAMQPRGVAVGRWPDWAVPQLSEAIALADAAPDGISSATLLYREWFNPEVAVLPPEVTARPLAGLYRTAHAGSSTRISSDDVSVVARNDLVRMNGWWRTWGSSWPPPRTRPGFVRLLLSPRAEALDEFVATVTGHLINTTVPWAFGCSTVHRPLTRSGSSILDVPDVDAVPTTLFDDLEPLLHPVVPPLSLPIAAGVGATQQPDNGMTFGEHRCHLVALGVRNRGAAEPLESIAGVFAAHGVDPAVPYRNS